MARLRSRYNRQLLWLRRRLTPGEYLGLHLTLGLLAAAGCLWIFGRLAGDIVSNDPLLSIDQMAATTLHELRTPALTAFFLVVTALGSIEAITLMSLVGAVIFGAWRRWLLFGTWVIAAGGSVVLILLLKALFARPRPYFEQPLLLEPYYSFPSGHAMEAVVLYGMLAYFAMLALRSWRARAAVVFGTSLLVLLIGFSRMYLGVHYLSDVVAGFAAGGVWLSTCITAMEFVRRGAQR
ncbi:MAG: phosphatase PAP2 family protein [Actinomycetota bacterium]|nr:phosphatase PAP2 family protein [Actinomycetota bacterium]